MSDYSLNANSISELKVAFKRASNLIGGQDGGEVTLTCSGDARAAMEEILNAKMKRNATSTVAAGGGSVAAGLTAAAYTAPFLGPFSLLVGMAAGVAAGVGADKVSRDVFLGDVIREYGEKLVEDAREYKPKGRGVYVRRVSPQGSGDYPYSGN